MGRCKKLGIILESSGLKVDVITNVNNKKCAPKLIFFNEKKKRKIQIIFDKVLIR